MRNIYSRSDLQKRRSEIYSDPQSLQENIPVADLPEDLVEWLSKLGLLYGVPFNYLVPDEGMLPPESIRFFYLDPNWVDALTDGAFSIGRNLTSDKNSPDMNLTMAVRPTVVQQVRQATPKVRARIFGMTAEEPTSDTITGFVLRSSLVFHYPGMGVNVYPKDHTPKDPNPESLKILRLEQLGPTSDTLICIVSGDAYQVDIHEAPQALHYGIDCFNNKCVILKQPVTAVKNLHTFGNSTTTDPVTKTTTNRVTMSSSVVETDISQCFRPNAPRVVEMSTLANLILQKNKSATPPPGTQPPTSIDSSEMGFEMTEGVGMVSFKKLQNKK